MSLYDLPTWPQDVQKLSYRWWNPQLNPDVEPQLRIDLLVLPGDEGRASLMLQRAAEALHRQLLDLQGRVRDPDAAADQDPDNANANGELCDDRSPES